MDQYKKLCIYLQYKKKNLLDAYRKVLSDLMDDELDEPWDEPDEPDEPEFNFEGCFEIAKRMNSIVPQSAEAFYLDKGIACLLNIRKGPLYTIGGKTIFQFLGQSGCVPSDKDAFSSRCLPNNQDDFSSGLNSYVLFFQKSETSYLDKAIEKWKRVVKTSDQQHVALCNFLLGWAYCEHASLNLESKDQKVVWLKEAIERYQQAVLYAPENAQAPYNYNLYHSE